MSTFIRKCRKDAGLTQAELAEKAHVSTVSVQNWESGKTKIELGRIPELAYIFNVPAETLIKEMLIEQGNDRPDNWPGFLFDEDTNHIIDTLHLNQAQQELFGLLYIYDADYLKKECIVFDTLDEDLKKIPYGFIEKVGSIRFMNQVEGLHQVIKYVRTDFLLKILKQNPEVEFDIKRLSKDQICDFIDSGWKPIDEPSTIGSSDERIETEDGLDFRISIKKSRILLPVLAKSGAVHFTDGWWSNSIRDDLPKDVQDAILSMCDFNPELWKDGYYKDKYQPIYVRGGLESVTDYKAVGKSGKEEQWMLSINDTGRKLLEWFDFKKG